MDEIPSEVDLPRAVALAWGVAANPQRGPKRELSIERIVEAAIAIADEDGLAAVSMSSVATALGFTTMSLYRYVTAKDDLIQLMQETGIGLPPASIAEAPDWRAGLIQWSRETLASYAAHPWLIDIPILGSPNTPNNLAWMDRPWVCSATRRSRWRNGSGPCCSSPARPGGRPRSSAATRSRTSRSA